MKKLLIVSAVAIVMLVPVVSMAGTIAHWTFGANGLTDITGNNAITLENHGVTFSNGGAVFDGSSYLVTTAPVELGATTKSFTLECWVRFDANNNLGYIFAPSDASEKGAFVVYQNGGKFYGQLRVVSPSTWQQEVQDLTGSTAYPHHIAYVVDASKSGADQAKLYLDGTPIPNSSLKTSGDFSTGFGSRKLFIGMHGNNGSPNNGFKGRIDDIRITDGALEPSQFLKFPTVCDAMTPANPAFAYYPFGADGPSDVSGNGNDLAWPTWQSSSPSYLDGTLSLNGSCSIGSTSTFPFSQFTKSGLTFECFFRTTSTADDARVLMETSGNYTGNIGAFHMSLRDDCTTLFGGLRTEDGSNVDKSTGTPAANDGHWHHAAMVYDPAKTGEDLLVTYLDGVKLPVNGTDTKSTLSLLCDASFFVGGRANYTLWATAEFDDVRIMPYALSPDEFLKAPSVNAPVAHWKFDSETPLVDATGNGNDLVNNGVTFADGAAVFNGSGATLKTASTLNLSAYRRATIECRYQHGTLDKFGVLFALENTAGSTPGSFVVYKYNNAIWAQFGTTSSWQQDGVSGLTASSPYVSAGWHHIAYVLDVTKTDANECVLYIDGVKQNQNMNNTATLSALLNQKLCIGGGSSYGSNHATTFDGKMSEIIITPQALTPNTFKLSRQPFGSGVIAYWDFSGSGWDDKSGNGHSLTAANVGKYKGAAKFTDVTASLATTAALDLSGCRSVTVECFAKSDSASEGAIFTTGDGAAAGSFGVFLSSTGTRAEYVPYADALNSESAATDDNWHHYALVIDGDGCGADQARFYIDGVRAASGAMASGATALLNSAFRIGGGYGGAAFSGLIDDVRISEGALAPSAFMKADERTEVLPGLIIKMM